MITQPKADVVEIKRALSSLFLPGDIVELRALEVGGKTQAGYFSDFDKLAHEAERLSGQASGVYVVLNQINKDLLARSQNRITILKNLTQDADITLRRWLPLDIDAKRPVGISSTTEEHEAALATATSIKMHLMEKGFQDNSILIGDSGNGAHVLARVNLPNDEETKAIVQSCIRAIAAKFDSAQVTIDQAVFNASRIWKVPGTMARKGDSTETRPHRIARLLNVPASITVARIELVKALAAAGPRSDAPQRTSTKYQSGTKTLDLEKWLTKYGIMVIRTEPYNGGTRYILQECPFNPEHNGTSVAAFQSADGVLGFKCQHNSCVDKTWAALRELKEPGYKDRQNNQSVPVSRNLYPLTDSGNAERFTNLHGKVVKYAHERKLWLLWSGQRWTWDNADDTGVMQLAKLVAREIPKEATPGMSKEEFGDLLDWAKQSESEKRLRAMVSLARNETGITISIRDLNTDNYLLNVLNGTIDLHTAQLLPHDPKHLITMMAPVTHDPAATCPEWDRFLQLVMAGNIQMIKYLRDITGYCLTGDNRTHIVPFCHGHGGNGKSTFLKIDRHIMGDYAIQVDPSVFLISKQQFKDGGTRETLADLFGKRLVTATEIDENRQLSINLLKAIMGGEDISGDRKYEHNIRFKPTFKVILSGNNEPIVHDSSDGAWRRLKKIPFTIKISNPIDGYEEDLMPEISGIFNWMLAGCLSWQQNGLSEPQEVQVATAEYRKGQDEFNQFFDDVCKLEIKLKTAKRDFKIAYVNWCNENGLSPYSDKTLRQKLLAHGVCEGHSGAVKEWKGVGLQRPEPTPEGTGPQPEGTESTPEGTGKTTNYPHEDETVIVNGKTGTNRYQRDQCDYTTILGMTIEQVLELWRSVGRPVIHLGPCENCFDLEELLSNANIKREHLEAVKTWADSVWAKL